MTITEEAIGEVGRAGVEKVIMMAGMAIGMTGEAVVAAMVTEMDTVGTGMEVMVATHKDIRNLMVTRNRSTSHHPYIIPLSNHLASVCFFRLIFVDK